MSMSCPTVLAGCSLKGVIGLLTVLAAVAAEL